MKSLAVNEPGDVFEREADRVADQVMRMPDPAVSAADPPSMRRSRGMLSLQRKCACGGSGSGCASCKAEDDAKLQRKATGSGAVTTAPPGVHDVLRSPGQPLDAATRGFMEPRFGRDFGDVRIHDDAAASESAHAVGARAYTVGSRIAFADGEYRPGAETGRRLLAHELMHVVQQSGAGPSLHAEGHALPGAAPAATATSGPSLQRVCGPRAIGTPDGCEPYGGVATDQISSDPDERFLFTVNCNDFITAAERARLRGIAAGIGNDDPVDIHGFASEEGDATYNAHLSCSRALRARDELVDARARANLPPLHIRGIYNHGATTFGTREVDRSVVIPLAEPPTIDVLDAGFIGPPAENQRRAAASCPIACDGHAIGTLNAMALFFHHSRGSVLPNGDPTADGIGTALHFTETAIDLAQNDPCNCDDYGIIQAIDRTSPPAGRANPGIDNSGQNTPFYDAIGLSGRGIHEIPGGYPDAGERVQSTLSIYDRPFIRTARWEATTCVACIKNNAPDRILGCVTYGFTRALTAAPGDNEQVTAIGPGCLDAPNATFLTALRTDPTVTNYDFEGR